MATSSVSHPRTTAAKPRESTAGFMLRLALLAWVLRCFIMEPFYIPSASMEPTMAIGDYLFVSKWPYGYSRYSFLWGFPPFAGRLLEHLPARGDVVVFKPTGREDTSWVKRVIGLPGDTIAVRDGVLVINGTPVPKASIGDVAIPVTPNSPCRTVGGSAPRVVNDTGRPVCLYAGFRETLPGGRSYTVLDQIDAPFADHFGPVTVPANSLFLMGDNRDDSEDSRYSVEEGGAGFVPVDHLVGRATIAFWSTDGSASYAKPWTWFTALRPARIGQGY